MWRWILSLLGAVLLAGPATFRQIEPRGILDVIGMANFRDDLPAWLRFSIHAGAYLIEWGPMVAGLLIIYYANRRRL